MFCCCFPMFLLKLLVPFCVGVFLFITVGIPVFLFVSKQYFKHKKSLSSKDGTTTVGFFHPYCNAGGGGERVLWVAIKAMQFRYRNIKVVVYTGDMEASPDAILERVQQRFNMTLTEPIEFVYLHRRCWVEAGLYPIFTLLGQSLGSLVLGMEALFARPPDIYIDTMGYAFTLPLFKYVGGCRVACYVHYPTITREMLHRVSRMQETHNNNRLVARSPFLTGAKVFYYRLFAWLYGLMGRCADTIMVNSSWTEEHINALWCCTLKTHRVYPPCDVDDLKKIGETEETSAEFRSRKWESFDGLSEEERSLKIFETVTNELGDLSEEEEDDPERREATGDGRQRSSGSFKVVSVGQFRPEKDHPLQLRSMYALRQVLPEKVWNQVVLVIIGSCRNAEDQRRVRDMQDLCRHLALEDNVQFKVNVSYEELKQEMSEAAAGLHSMWNEHFGIGIVECMAAGLIMVAHNSGGPKADIIETSPGSRTGYLATDEGDYARALATIILMSPKDRHVISQRARASVDRFSTKEFERGFLRAIDPLFARG